MRAPFAGLPALDLAVHSGTALAGTTLAGAFFTGTILTGVPRAGAPLVGTSLSGASLAGAWLAERHTRCHYGPALSTALRPRLTACGTEQSAQYLHFASPCVVSEQTYAGVV
jgi:uncharacterized protein YjbI with pentapeptide repeats